MLTQPFADAIRRAEKIISEAAHVRSEQDLREGYDYLAGSIRPALQSAWTYDRDFPCFSRSVTPYTKLGLDNPDTLYSAPASGTTPSTSSPEVAEAPPT